MYKQIVLASLLIGVSVSSFAFQENDPAKLCASAAELFKDGDIEGALEEARWCVTQLEQIKQNQTATFFKDEINGFKGEPLSQQSAMGMSVVERRYIKGNNEIQVTLTGGATAGAMNAFSALAQFGVQAGNNKVRIQKRSGSVTVEDGHVTLMLSLKSGGMLNFESNSVGEEDLLNFAKQFPVKDLDNSLLQ